MSLFKVDDLPEDVQRSLYEQLALKFQRRRRDGSRITKERKLRALSDILRVLDGLSLAQQRSVLLFALAVLQNSQHRFWRDEKARKQGGKVYGDERKGPAKDPSRSVG